LAYWFYIDGVDTVIRMSVDYGMSLGFPSSALITALLMVQFIAFPATLVYGRLADKFGTQRALLVGIGGYGVITVFAFFMTQEWHFYALAAAVGIFQGGIQAMSRSLYCRLIPERSAAQFYGFYNMLGKFAAVLGPIMLGGVTLITGNARFGILSIILLFIIGGLLLSKIDIEKGEQIARNHSQG
jgi:UMF1 family MFS transporter